MRFPDRREAGRRLATRLAALPPRDPVVLALPRGGVPVGLEIARALAAPLDVILVRKIGAPGQEEYALAAIAEGDPPELVINPAFRHEMGALGAYLDKAKAAALVEIARRRARYLPGRAPVPLAGRTAIVVDDGIATGATMLAALRAVRHRKPASLVLAVPVAPPDTLARLRGEVDEAICLSAPEEFLSVGQFYDSFPQLEDDEVIALLARAAPPP